MWVLPTCTWGPSIDISRAWNFITDEAQEGTDPVQHAGDLSGDWPPPPPPPRKTAWGGSVHRWARLLQGQRPLPM